MQFLLTNDDDEDVCTRVIPMTYIKLRLLIKTLKTFQKGT